jgi:transposase
MSRFAGSGGLQIVGLSQEQETALAALRAGSSFPKAAEQAGVNRTTVYRWVQRDPAFRAAYNAWQRELTESASATLLKLTERAVEVVAEALKEGDREIAFKMLRHMGVLRRRKRGSTDQEVLKLQIDLKEKRELRRAEGNMTNCYMKKMGIPQRDRRRVIQGRATPKFMEELQAVLDASEPTATGQAAHATTGANPGDISVETEREQAPEAERKAWPGRGMGQSAGAEAGGPADATTRATGDALSHEQVA